MTADQGGPLVCCAEHLVIVGAAPGAALGNGAVKALAVGLGVVVDIFWVVCIVLYVKRKFCGIFLAIIVLFSRISFMQTPCKALTK